MSGIELFGAACVLVVTTGVGLVAHEFAHAFVLRTLGVPCDVEWLPACTASGRFDSGADGAWATVTPRVIPRDCPSSGIRLAAIAPVALATPALLVVLGPLPDPLASGDPLIIAATVGWLACALPSPQDFSVFWHADRALVERPDAPRR